eukprot:scaffold42917_cov62-Phaeocystis_antarctica.AAC.2
MCGGWGRNGVEDGVVGGFRVFLDRYGNPISPRAECHHTWGSCKGSYMPATGTAIAMSTTVTVIVLGLVAAPAQAIKATPTPPPLEEARALVAGPKPTLTLTLALAQALACATTEEVRALVAGRNVAVFFHIAKAGGSSINSLFRKEGAEVANYP